jgi:hypothetical protein
MVDGRGQAEAMSGLGLGDIRVTSVLDGDGQFVLEVETLEARLGVSVSLCARNPGIGCGPMSAIRETSGV